MEQFLDMIIPVARRIGIPEFIHDEAYSEGLVHVVEAYRRYNPERGASLVSYMRDALYYRLKDWYRREGYRGEGCLPMPEYLDPVRHDRPQEHARGLLEEALEACQALAEPQKVAVCGAAWGLTHWELSRVLRMNGSQLSALQRSTRLQLRQQLGA